MVKTRGVFGNDSKKGMGSKPCSLESIEIMSTPRLKPFAGWSELLNRQEGHPKILVEIGLWQPTRSYIFFKVEVLCVNSDYLYDKLGSEQ